MLPPLTGILADRFSRLTLVRATLAAGWPRASPRCWLAVEVVYLITSDRDADPATLAAWVRGHWETGNRLH